MKLLFMIVLVTTVLISGCTEKNVGDNINTPVEPKENINTKFESIDIGNSNNIENINGSKISVINNISQLQDFANLNKDIVDKLKQVDYDRRTVIGIFRGKMQSSGFGITVKEIKSKNDKMIIIVNLTDPSGEATQPIISYPYHIITIPKENMKDILEVYTDNNEKLASINE